MRIKCCITNVDSILEINQACAATERVFTENK